MTVHRYREVDSGAGVVTMIVLSALVTVAFLLGFIAAKAWGAETIPAACQGYAKSDCPAVMEMR